MGRGFVNINALHGYRVTLGLGLWKCIISKLVHLLFCFVSSTPSVGLRLTILRSHALMTEPAGCPNKLVHLNHLDVSFFNHACLFLSFYCLLELKDPERDTFQFFSSSNTFKVLSHFGKSNNQFLIFVTKWYQWVSWSVSSPSHFSEKLSGGKEHLLSMRYMC